MQPRFRAILLIVLSTILLTLFPQHIVSAKPFGADTTDFVISIQTSWDFTIPTHPEETYNYNIDCDSDNLYEATNVTGPYTCTYETAGSYTITISDNTGNNTGFPRIYFKDSGDRNKLISIDQWGTSSWVSMNSAFFTCENLTSTAIDAPNLTNVKDMSEMFAGALSFNGAIGDWDTSNVTNMSKMFMAADTFNQDIGDWNTSNVKDMSAMFFHADEFNQDISGWDTSNVENMSNMFSRTWSFNQNLNDWDISNVTDMSKMFAGALAFNSPVDSWDTSNVINMSYLFSETPFFNQDIGNWDTHSVNDMSWTFYHAAVFNQDISNWNTSNVIDMTSMFLFAESFNQNLGGWNVTQLNSAGNMFRNAKLSTQNYDALLIGWNEQAPQNNVTFDGGNSTYCTGENARQNLIDIYGWTINDGAKDCQIMGTPTPRFPKNNYPITAGVTTLKWTVVNGASGYDIELYRPNGDLLDAWQAASSGCDDTLCQFKLPYKLETEFGTYQWRARAVDGAFFGAWSELAAFDYIALDQLNLLTPTNNAVINTSNPTFTWQHSTQGVYRYVLEIWSLSGQLVFTSNERPAILCTDNTCTWTPAMSFADGTYKWRILGKKWPNSTNWTTSNFFTINGSTWTGLDAGTVFTPPAVRFPKNGYIITAGTTLIKWAPISSAGSYVLELYRPGGDWFDAWEIASTACDQTICQFKLPYKLGYEFGEWQWRIRAKNGASVGQWSSYATFAYVQLDVLTVTSPINSALVETSTPTLIWQDSDQGIYKYVIEIWTRDGQLVSSELLAPGTVCTAGTCSWISTINLTNGTYNWRILGKKWPNTTGWSTVETFIVQFP